MNKTDSTDFTNRIKSLLEIMTNNCSEESSDSEDEDSFLSSDETCSENDDDDSDLSEADDSSNDHYSATFRLNKFFLDNVDNTEKHVPLTPNNNANNDIQFEEKMYRVIPLKLDKKIFQQKIPFSADEIRNLIKSL